MIPLDAFLARVKEIDEEKPEYKKGGDGSRGNCDCIGLIIGAIRRAGGEWKGSHGSNYAARYEVSDLRQITKAADLEIGEVVFKRRAPGESGYSLPSSYADHWDLDDYYHVGVVISVTPLCIVHCTAPTTKHDSKIGKWSRAARLKKVAYAADGKSGGEEGETQVLYSALVTTKTDPLLVREWPVTGTKLGKVPKGRTVAVCAESDDTPGWFLIRYEELEGYASGEYLQPIGDVEPSTPDDPEPDEDPEPDGNTVAIPRDIALQLYLALAKVLNVD